MIDLDGVPSRCCIDLDPQPLIEIHTFVQAPSTQEVVYVKLE